MLEISGCRIMKHPNAPAPSSLRPLPLGAVALGLLCFGAASLADVPTQAQADLLEDARGCTSETQRLERLACFDEVFGTPLRSEEHTSELQSRPHLVCRLLLEK